MHDYHRVAPCDDHPLNSHILWPAAMPNSGKGGPVSENALLIVCKTVLSNLVQHAKYWLRPSTSVAICVYTSHWSPAVSNNGSQLTVCTFVHSTTFLYAAAAGRMR